MINQTKVDKEEKSGQNIVNAVKEHVNQQKKIESGEKINFHTDGPSYNDQGGNPDHSNWGNN